MAENTEIFIALGSNLGDRLANINRALVALAPEVQLVKAAAIYETRPVGFAAQDNFFNTAVQASTTLEPLALFQKLQTIEKNFGREKKELNGPRVIDLDIIFYDRLWLQSKLLTIPHPRAHERDFVLRPLADINAELLHPTLKESVAQLLAKVTTRSVLRVVLEDAH